MTILYKLTDQDGYTRQGETNETLWAENTTHEATGFGGLCTSGVIHAYTHPLIAVLMNPIHANLSNPLLWECEGEVVAKEGQLKCGCKKLTTVRRVDLPTITIDQRVRIAIYCALKRYSAPSFVKWANAWLDRSDRSQESAEAEAAAEAAARAAAAEAAAEAAARATAAWAAAWAAAVAVEAAEDFDLLAIIKLVVEEGK
jgi:hypothetical protein